jgi:hypothetical protein
VGRTGYPLGDLGKHVGTQQLGQGEHINFVSLDTSGGDEFHLGWMDDHGTADQGDDLVVDCPGIGGGLKHHLVGGEQIGLSPGQPARELDLVRLEHDTLLGVDRANHEVVLVNVDGNEALDVLKGKVTHATLLV